MKVQNNVLIVNVCKEKLHFYEFVKPVGDVLVKNNVKGFIRRYDCLAKKDLEKSSKVIICGTSLADFEYIGQIDKFNWIKDYGKPILGICAGMQIIVKLFGGELEKNEKIGLEKINFKKGFLGANGEKEVYQLHGLSVIRVGKDFEVYSKSPSGIGAIKHKQKKIFGCLFHPEVRNKELIEEFVKENKE